MMELIYFEIYRDIIRLKFDVWWEEVVMGRDFSLMFLFYTHVAHVMLVDLEIKYICYKILIRLLLYIL